MTEARTGSIATKAMSQLPLPASSNTLPAALYGISSTGTPSRRPSSRARSGVMPLVSPVASSFCASTELPRLIAARSLPVGARSLSASAMAAAENPPVKAAASKAVCRMDMVMVGSPPIVMRKF